VTETIEEKCQRYLNGDRRALDYTYDEEYEREQQQRQRQRSAYVPSVDPASFHTQHGFVKACVIDLTANGFDQAEAFAACKERWAEHETIGSPVTAGQKVVRAELEKRQNLATQKSWEGWFDQRFENAIKPFVEHLGTIIGEIERENLKAVEAHNEIVKDIDDAEEEAIAAHNLLVREVREIRDDVRAEMHREMDRWIVRKDREFSAEVAELREKTIRMVNEDMTVIKDDVIAVVRAELADEFVKNFVEANDQIRREIRAEMAAKLKMLRSTLKRNRTSS
jgi:hypothetical protein